MIKKLLTLAVVEDPGKVVAARVTPAAKAITARFTVR